MSQGTDFFDIDISIIIPTYNRKELLMQTLSSIDRCKKEGIKLEVIIVDEGSSDGSEETIKKQEYNFNYHYHYHEDKGYRVSLSRNVGAKLSRGRILAFVDSGMIVGSNFLKAHKKLHDESQNLAVIGYMYAIEQNLSKSSREKLSQLYLKQNVDEFCNSIVNSHEFSDIREPVFEASSDTLTRLPYPWAIFWTGNVSIKRELYNKTQGFDENYTSWRGEDVDFGYSLYRLNCTFQLSRDGFAIRIPRKKENIKTNNLLAKENREYFYNKYKTPEVETLLNGKAIEM